MSKTRNFFARDSAKLSEIGVKVWIFGIKLALNLGLRWRLEFGFGLGLWWLGWGLRVGLGLGWGLRVGCVKVAKTKKRFRGKINSLLSIYLTKHCTPFFTFWHNQKSFRDMQKILLYKWSIFEESWILDVSKFYENFSKHWKTRYEIICFHHLYYETISYRTYDKTKLLVQN